jgi:2-hydroxychromene-2-carboxylate isomerase
MRLRWANSISTFLRSRRAVWPSHELAIWRAIWRRELDIEDAEAIGSVLSEVRADRTGFRSYLADAGRMEHVTIHHSAESAGVFGVPSFIVEGELFWGREHLAEIREKLAPFARNNSVRATPSC